MNEITLSSRVTLLILGVILPFAAFSAAYQFKTEKRKIINYTAFAIGVCAIIGVGIVLQHNSY